MNDRDFIEAAVKKFIGHSLRPGCLVAHYPGNSLMKEFVRYEGDYAVLTLDGIETRIPRHEVFDVNKVKDEAIRLKIAYLSGFVEAAPVN